MRKIILGIFLVSLFASVSVKGAITHYVPVDEDADIRQWDSENNFGQDDELYITAASSSSKSEVFIKASTLLSDLSCFTDPNMVVSAKLKVYEKYSNGNLATIVTMVDSEWTEDTIIWNNAPYPRGDEILKVSGLPEGTGSGWKSIDITEAVKRWIGRTAINYGVNIYSYTGGVNAPSHWHSSETSQTDLVSPYRTRAPYIEIVFENQINVAIDNDATVFKNHANSANNYGSETTLMLYNATPSSYEQMIYLQATTLIDELSGYSSSDILSATVYLYDYHNYRDAEARIYVADTQWDEATITGNNAPAYSTSYTNTVFWPKQLGWVSFDATNEVKDWLSGEVINYGLVIKMAANSTYSIRFHSSEYSANTGLRPYLQIVVKREPICCGHPGTIYLTADFNKDCQIDIEDFTFFAQKWLECKDPQGCN